MDKSNPALVIIILASLLAAAAAIATTKNRIGNDNMRFCPPSRNPPPPPPHKRAEPSFFQKQGRRFTVFRVATKVFVEYKFAKRKAKKMQSSLGLSDEQAEDDPSIQEFWNKIHQRNAIQLTDKIKKLEGFWVKVGQYLSSRADVMPKEYLSELASLQDSMPPKPFKEIMSTIQEELTQDEQSRIVFIDEEPLSTASLAQVHRARLVDGQEVVLKVQHRGVASLMMQDMDNLKLILNWIAKFEPDADFGPVIREYNSEVRKELDFRTEATNMEEIRQLLLDNKIKAIVPKFIPGLVTERVLVMEFCHGFAVRDLELLDKYSVNRELLLERICGAWAVQMHVGGAFNADPHYGNILVSTSPESEDASVPVLLDFGLTKRLNDTMKVAFSRLMHASDETDVDSLLQSFEEMGLQMNRYDPFEDMASMQRSFRETVPQAKAREIQSQRSKDYQRRTEAMKQDQGVEKNQKLRNPVEAWPAELVFFGRVTNLLRGLCSRLDVNTPYLAIMASKARTTLRDSVPFKERASQLVHSSSTMADTGIDLQRNLIEAIQKLEASSQMVGLQLCVISKGKEVVNIAAGVLGTANPRPVMTSTLFNIFSAGKALLTIGVLGLVQDGVVELDDSISKHWPAFGKHDITIRHVLSHQAGLANALPEAATLDTLLDWSRMKEHMEEAVPEHEAGSSTKYHYLTFCWICGGLIEAVLGEPYDSYLDRLLQKEDTQARDLHVGGLPSTVESHELAVLSLLRDSGQTKLSKDEPQNGDVSAPKANEQAGQNDQAPSNSNSSKTVLAKYRGREQLLNPSIFNMRKVREAKLPSANMHASASSLAAIFDSILTKETPLTMKTVDEARKRQGSSVEATTELLDDSSAYFGLGFQVHEFTFDGRKMLSFGHAGLGGSIVFSIPEANLTVAFTTNQLAKDSAARKILLGLIFEEYGIDAPPSMQQ
jgi:aarF domain-containing kinase